MNKAGDRPSRESRRRLRSMLFAPQILFVCLAVGCAEFIILFAASPLLRSIGLRLQQGLFDFLLGFELATFFASVAILALLFTGAGQ